MVGVASAILPCAGNTRSSNESLTVPPAPFSDPPHCSPQWSLSLVRFQALKSGISPHPQVNYLFAAAWAIIFTALYLLALDSFIGKPGVDSSLYIYASKGILEGDLPYLDRWVNKGPLLLLLNLIGLVIHKTWGLWIVQGLFLLGASTSAFLVLRRGFGIIPALFALALFLSFFATFAPPGNFTEQYGLLFQFLTLYLFLRSLEQPSPAPSQARFASLHLAIGALGAASFLLRPNLVALWIVIGLFWLVMRGSSLRKLAWAAVGGGSILILVAGLFIAIGAWECALGSRLHIQFRAKRRPASGQT